MNAVVVGDRRLEDRGQTLDVPTMRADLERILGEILVRELTTPDGEVVPATAEVLAGTTPVVGENNQRELRANYHLAYREVRFSEEGVIKVEHPARLRFEALILNMMHNTRAALMEMQPNCDWQMVAAMVDPVSMSGLAQKATGGLNAPGSFDPSIRVMQAVARGEVSDDGGAIRMGARVTQTAEAQHWRWYIRMVWADVSGSGEWVDPIEVRGGKAGPHAKYAATRYVRTLPPGGRKNREEAVKLLQRVGVRTAIAPAQSMTDEQQQGALVMLSAGMNPALVARTLGVLVADVEGLIGEKVKRPRKPKAAADGEEAAV